MRRRSATRVLGPWFGSRCADECECSTWVHLCPANGLIGCATVVAYGMVCAFTAQYVLPNNSYRIATLTVSHFSLDGMPADHAWTRLAESRRGGMGWKQIIMIQLSGQTARSRVDVRTARLQSLARRTMVGSLATMSAGIVNFLVVMVHNGVSAWVCLIVCKLDGELDFVSFLFFFTRHNESDVRRLERDIWDKISADYCHVQ